MFCTLTSTQDAHVMTPFTPGERNIMRLLWEHGEMRPAELQKLYPEPIKNPALRSYLTILLDKGHVTRRKVGKAFVYKAATRRHSAFRKTLRELVDTYCDGSTQSLLLNLIRAEKLDDDELLRLGRLADQSDPPASDETTRARR
jgi:BlaI family transcriptional regulator, penicillinase repressor